MHLFLKRFLPYLRGYLRFFIISVVAGIITGVCTSLIAYLIKPVLDEVFIKKDATMLVVLPIFVVGAYIGKSVGSYIQSYFMNYIGQDIVRRIRDELLTHMLNFEMFFFNKMRGGELIARITSDIEAIRAASSNYIADLIRDSVTIVALIFVVIYQSKELSVIGLFIIPLALIPVSLISKKIKKNSKQLMEKNSDITSRLSEIFNNAEIIKINNCESIESESFKKSNFLFFKINMRLVRLNLLTSPLMEVLGASMVAIVIYIGGHEVIENSMTSGQFFSFMTALFMIYTPLKKVLSSYAAIQTAFIAGNRIFEMLERKPSIIDGEKTLENIQSIRFRDVVLNYEGDKLALNGINLDFYKNEVIALKGKSGSGKSSIINLILRLYDPSSGEVLFNDLNLKNYTQQSIRDSIAVVTQRTFIFNDTIAFNVAYGLDFDENRVIESLKKAFAWDFVSSLEDSIYTKLDEFGANLSGGQRQRIAIARAIYKNPQVFIFDEATSALDEKTEELIKQTINNLKKDKIIIIVAHRPSTLSLATKIINIEEGALKNEENKTTLP